MVHILSWVLHRYFDSVYGWNWLLLKLAGAKIERGVKCHSIESVSSPGKLSVKSGTWIGPNVSLYAEDGIEIGKNCMISKDVSIISVDHKYSDRSQPIIAQGYNLVGKPVMIGNNVWIGEKAIILKGVCLEDNVIVGAGSVVTKSVKRNTVVAGNPAKTLGRKVK